jgi:hypothetical protein
MHVILSSECGYTCVFIALSSFPGSYRLIHNVDSPIFFQPVQEYIILNHGYESNMVVSV